MRGHPSRQEPWWASSGPITGCHCHHLLAWWSKPSEHLSSVSHSTCRPGTSQNTVEWPDIYLLSRASLWRIVRRPFSEGTLLCLVYSYSKVRRLILPHPTSPFTKDGSSFQAYTFGVLSSIIQQGHLCRYLGIGIFHLQSKVSLVLMCRDILKFGWL